MRQSTPGPANQRYALIQQVYKSCSGSTSQLCYLLPVCDILILVSRTACARRVMAVLPLTIEITVGVALERCLDSVASGTCSVTFFRICDVCTSVHRTAIPLLVVQNVGVLRRKLRPANGAVSLASFRTACTREVSVHNNAIT